MVNGYIADIHGNENIPGLAACKGAPAALGSGTACYIAQAQYYNQAFGTFFARLAAMGVTAANTLFILSSDEGDHEAGANVGRAIQPTPANCDGVTVPCTYPAGTFGELAGNLTGLLATQKNDTTPFTVEDDTAPEFYVTGDPAPGSSTVRTLERDVAGLTAANPDSAGPDSGQVTVVDSGTKGTWTDETDIEPTELSLLGLRGDYDRDGRVITEILRDPNPALRGDDVTRLGACYKQLNSSVGEFGAYTLIASTRAVESATPGDALFTSVNAKLLRLEKARDALAGQIKQELNDAAFSGVPVRGAGAQTVACAAIINAARQLAQSS